MTSKFRALYKVDGKDLIHQFVLYTLKNSQYYKNHINFNDSDILNDYLKTLLNLVYKKDIRLIVYNYQQASSDDLKQWRPIIKKFPSSQTGFVDNSSTKGAEYQKKIRVELSLVSQTEDDRIKERSQSGLLISAWTVRTLQIFCHYVFIMIGDRILSNEYQ